MSIPTSSAHYSLVFNLQLWQCSSHCHIILDNALFYFILFSVFWGFFSFFLISSILLWPQKSSRVLKPLQQKFWRGLPLWTPIQFLCQTDPNVAQLCISRAEAQATARTFGLQVLCYSHYRKIISFSSFIYLSTFH